MATATSVSIERPAELTSAGVLQTTPKPQLDALTGARFIAAVLVVIAHIEMMWHLFAVTPDVPPAMAAWSARGDAQLLGIPAPGYELSNAWYHVLSRGIVLGGYIAVDLFFMLSGFVLTYTCVGEDGKIRIHRGGFWATRFARIYPVFLVGLLVYLPLFFLTTSTRTPPMSGAERAGMMAATLALVQAWWPEAANAWNPPAWTLSAEAFFYVLFPFLLVYVDRLRRNTLWLLLVGCYLAALIPPAIYVLVRPDPGYNMEWLGEGTWLRVIKYNPLIRFPEFFAGLILGKLFAYQAMQNARNGRGSRGWLSILALLGALAVMCTTYYMPYPLMHNGILMPFVGLLIYDLAMGGGPVGWLFSTRPMVLLGNSTYCIYILHSSFVGYAFIVMLLLLGGGEMLKYDAAKREAAATGAPEPAPPDLSSISPDSVASPMAFVGWVSLACLLTSIVMYKLYEEPCRRYLRRKLSRRAHLKIPPPAKSADLP